MAAEKIFLDIALAIALSLVRVFVFNRIFPPRWGRLNYLLGCGVFVVYAAARLWVNAGIAAHAVLWLAAAGLFISFYVGKWPIIAITYVTNRLIEILFAFLLLGWLDIILKTVPQKREVTLLLMALVTLLSGAIAAVFTVTSCTHLLSGMSAIFALSSIPVPLFLVAALSMIHTQMVESLIDARFHAAFIGITAILAGAFILEITAMLLIQKRMNQSQRLLFLKEQVKLQREHYHELYGYVNRFENARKESKEMLDTALKLMQRSEYSKASTLIHEAYHQFDDAQFIQVCKNKTANALLSNKFKEAANKGIDCDFSVNIGEDIGIDDVSLCSVLGNIMDNAIRACSELQDSIVKKTISFKCAIKSGYLIIKEENPFEGRVTARSDNSLETTKQDKHSHGVGTQVIARVAQQYDGAVNYRQQDGVFCVLVTLKLNKG